MPYSFASVVLCSPFSALLTIWFFCSSVSIVCWRAGLGVLAGMRQTRRSIGAFGDASNVKILKAPSTLASKHSLRTHASALPHRFAVSWTEAGCGTRDRAAQSGGRCRGYGCLPCLRFTLPLFPNRASDTVGADDEAVQEVREGAGLQGHRVPPPNGVHHPVGLRLDHEGLAHPVLVGLAQAVFEDHRVARL